MGSIYVIRNSRNGKCYVGQTTGDAVRDRLYYHINGRGSRLMKNAVEKYGRDAFTFEVIHDGVLDCQLDDLEIEAIKKYNSVAPNGYNLTSGGFSKKKLSDETKQKISQTKIEKGYKPFLGRNHTPEAKRKISLAHQGKIVSNETKRKISLASKNISSETRKRMSEAKRGKRLSIQHRQKISASNIGRKHTTESRQRISEANKGKVRSEETRQRISDANRGTKHTFETKRKMSLARQGKVVPESTRRKISEAKKGEKHHYFGKTFSEEHRRKISNALMHPDHAAARDYFFFLPPEMSLTEKRRLLYSKFPNVDNSTIRKWVRKWKPKESD